jgi:flagellin-like protein
MLQQMVKPINKRALSEMISYVLLIAIVIVAAVAVTAWVMSWVNVEPVIDCEPETSIIMNDYNCTGTENISLVLNLKNNGRFNIGGVTISVGNDTNSTPDTYLIAKDAPVGSTPGRFWFDNRKLAPGESKIVKLTNRVGNPTGFNSVETSLNFNITTIQIQPFIFDKGSIVVCQGTIIREKLENCA